MTPLLDVDNFSSSRVIELYLFREEFYSGFLNQLIYFESDPSGSCNTAPRVCQATKEMQ